MEYAGAIHKFLLIKSMNILSTWKVHFSIGSINNIPFHDTPEQYQLFVMFLHGKSIYIRTFTLHEDEAPLSILKANSSLSDRYCSVKIVVGKHTRIQFDPDPNPGRIL